MDRASIIFCVACVIVFVGVSWVAFPFAAMDPEEVALARTPQPAELLDMVDVGQGFGELPVIELMGYYVENPPVVAAGAAAAPEIKFGGC
ncbi:hypothetical protein [Sinisalibacter aestuarii]|uniref:Uncharacterized protein n=1 Tax=Sinisalibacter aestuarii TaxID=2949426 RepID=A0ABQ5LTX7_9RHOB|nr:hypothetical protein [Sinisalibacter aestuarii]GKY88430.1 hypothetical protein STA1M1_22990 [Sinisalibacter aestuarii]